MADLTQKEMIFGFVEVIFGLATAVYYSTYPVMHRKAAVTALIYEGCVGGLVPLMMRFSVRFFTNNALPKTLDIMVVVWGLALYLWGGIAVFAFYLMNAQLGAGVFALIAGIMCAVDLIVGLVGK